MLNRKVVLGILLGIIGAASIALATADSAFAYINDKIEVIGNRGFAVSPMIQSVNITPGVVSEGEYRVRSTASQEWHLRAGVVPLTVAGEDYEVRTDEFTPRNEIVRWTELSLRGCDIDKYEDGMMYFTMQSQDECFVQYTIDVPASAPSGAQHAMFFVEDLPEMSMNASGTMGGVIHNNRIGVSVLANNSEGDAKLCAKLIEQRLPFWVQDGPLNTDYLIKNCGNLDFYSDVSLEVYNLLGNLVYRSSSVVRKPVLADTTRRITISWDTAGIGIYKVRQTVQYLGEEPKVKNGVVLMVPLWLMIVMLVVLIAIIYMPIHTHKRAKKKYSKR